jgi:hypothetical protein
MQKLYNKLLYFILLIGSSSLYTANHFFGLQRCIQQNRIEEVRHILRQMNLTQAEKQFLLEQAHQNVIKNKAELEHFTASADGFKRKIIGTCLGLHGAYGSVAHLSIPSFIELVCGYFCYSWGVNATHQANVEGKISAINNYEIALTVEELIKNAPTRASVQ